MSAKAMETLSNIQGKLTGKELYETTQKLIKQFPISRTYHPYMPFNSNEIIYYHKKYLNDITLIKENFTSLSFYEPHPIKDHQSIDFLGIGVQKSATTWLHHLLSQHNNVSLPPKKELHYFDRHLNYPSPSLLATSNPIKRLFSKQPHNIEHKKAMKNDLKQALKLKDFTLLKWYLNYYFGYYNDNWYLSLFKARSNQIQGEITPSYSFLTREDIAKIKSLFPNLKIILMLRNPIDRAWSHIRFHIKRNLFDPNSNMEQIIKFIESPKQTLRGDYPTILKNWSDFFPAEQIHICFYDEVITAPENLAQNVYNFLDIEPNASDYSQLKNKFNVSIKKEMPAKIAIYLAQKYIDDIVIINNRYHSYTDKWLAEARFLLENKIV